MKEAEFSRLVTDFFEKRNGFVFNCSGGPFQKIGMPDLYIAHEHLPRGDLWLELKVENNKLTPAQKTRIRQLRERGVDAYWLRLIVEENKAWTLTLGYSDTWIAKSSDLETLWDYIKHSQLKS